ncbi:MAG: DNA primase [Patescibacteria group bacterium UBA2163]
MSDTVEQIKDRLGVVEVLAPYVKLTKAGRYHKGLCPFHNEKTPSFMVNPERGFYHCFGCNKGGDIFSFIQEIEGLDFRGALKLLAEKAGVEITNERPENRDRKEKLFTILADAQRFFTDTLTRHIEAKEYIQSRGITTENGDRWQLGYAPQAWQDTLDHLTEKGHDPALIELAGLAKQPDAADKDTQKEGVDTPRRYDRFRGRVMFPIRDISGRVIGFSGRIFPETTQEQAKYLNSPETPVFDKSRILYGLDFAREAIRKYNFAILVEGQLDVLLAHQTSYTNTVALSGTAFTAAHAQLIKRYTENLVLAFDGDRAGVSASGRAAAIALETGLNVKIATLPSGEDPADIINRDIDAWKSVIKGAEHVVDFYLSYLESLGYDERRFKLEVSRVVLPYVARIPNAIDQAHFVGRVAKALAIPEDAVVAELEKIKPSTTHTTSRATQEATTTSPQNDESPEHAAPFLSRGDSIERLLIGLVQALDQRDHELHETVLMRLTDLLGKERIDTLVNAPDESRVALIEGDLFLDEHEGKGELMLVIDELFDDFKKELARIAYRDAVMQLKAAEDNGNAKEVEAALQRLNTLAQALSE